MTVKSGYNNFKKNELTKYQSRMKELGEGQSPKTFFITCSDSRICPNLMTNTSFGELFVVRNAGNTIPAPNAQVGNGDKATLEYAVEALGVEEIVVCGHTKCGAVGALMSGVDQSKLPNIADYLKELEPLKKFAEDKGLTGDDVVRENVKAQCKNIAEYDFVKNKLESGDLKLVGWMYDIENGEVEEVSLEGIL